jgi:RNA polymerase sigma-70 factor (ECF subfamily)
MTSTGDAADASARVRDLDATFADPVAFRAWYEGAVGRVYAYLVPRCGGDLMLAEELTQQTFIQAIEHRATFEGRASAITWLCTIARNKLTDHYRRLDREERRHLRLVVREIPRATVDPDASRIEDREVVIEALRDLPALQRAAIVLCYIDGLSVREASGVLGRSESATESLLSRARERLRQTLQERPDGR